MYICILQYICIIYVYRRKFLFPAVADSPPGVSLQMAHESAMGSYKREWIELMLKAWHDRRVTFIIQQ